MVLRYASQPPWEYGAKAIPARSSRAAQILPVEESAAASGHFILVGSRESRQVRLEIQVRKTDLNRLSE
jgi:hypothetical protein